MSALSATCKAADKSGLAVLNELDKESMASGSLDLSLEKCVGESEIDTENQEMSHGRSVPVDLENCSPSILGSHTVKKRLVFDDNSEPSSSKRLRVEYNLNENSHSTDVTIVVCIAHEK